MLAAILHNAVSDDAPPEERDVLVQVEIVRAALTRLGHETRTLPCDLDLQGLREDLARLRPAVVFNLVESLGGFDRLQQLVPALLEMLGVPFTGASSAALVQTNDKLLAKRLMLAAELPTPEWMTLDGDSSDVEAPMASKDYIIKAVGEHASLGIDDESVVRCTTRKELLARLQDKSQRLGRRCFAEAFVAGREFNLSMLAGLVLPPAEIDFSSFPLGQPKIVGYRAKWDESAPEFSGTPRTFDFPAADRPLLDELCSLAVRTWRLFELRGYARVDFRVDERGRPWILEVNTNPCLSPDAGFYAALLRAGISFDEAVERILEDALAG